MLGEVDLWRRLAGRIVAQVNERCDGIVSGAIESLERYRFETGFVQGLQWVLGQAEDIAKAAPPGEDEQSEER
jgi:hypothetical protein